MDYAELLDGDMTEIERKVFDALRRHPGGLVRSQLVAIVYSENVRAGATSNNNSKDRKIRMAIANLRMRMVPIVSSSTEAGYRLDTSPEARQAMLGELISRRNKLQDLIDRTAKFYQLMEVMPEPEQAVQARLI